MARLILTEDGTTRRFRLNPGKLTVGSGEGATLKLSSDDVAEVHAELDFDGDELTLHVRKGVMPASMRGRKVTGEVKFLPGVPVKIGDAVLTLEDDESAAPGKPAGRARAGRTAAGTPRRKVAAAPAGSGGQRSRSVVESKRRTTTKSAPTWLIMGGVLVVAIGGFFVFKGFASTTGKRMVSAVSVQHGVQDSLDNADFGSARKHLERLDAAVADGSIVLTPEWQKIFNDLRKQTTAIEDQAVVAQHNVKGTEWLQKSVKNFEKTYLRKNTRPEARVFVKRLQQFRKEYPTHPELDWCARMEDRYKDIAALHTPDEFEDIKFQIRMLTGGVPRDYKQSLELLITAFANNASPSEKDKALALWDEKVGEREAYFDDRIKQAEYFWDRDQKGKAVEVLVKIVTIVGDEAMADDAAARIAKMGEDVIPAMKGYQRDRPDDFAGLVANPVMRDFLAEHGLVN